MLIEKSLDALSQAFDGTDTRDPCVGEEYGAVLVQRAYSRRIRHTACVDEVSEPLSKFIPLLLSNTITGDAYDVEAEVSSVDDLIVVR